jgi:phospholipid-transporting ATPase
VKNVNFESSALTEDLIPGSKNYSKAEAMLLNLALNHSVLIGTRGYCASSPDELALVNAAKFVGFKFVGRDNRDNTVTISIKGKQTIYKLL